MGTATVTSKPFLAPPAAPEPGRVVAAAVSVLSGAPTPPHSPAQIQDFHHIRRAQSAYGMTLAESTGNSHAKFAMASST